MRPAPLTVFLVAATLAAGLLSAVAADLPRTGQFDFVACLAGKTGLDRARTRSFCGDRRVVGDSPSGGLFDVTTSRCVYSYGYLEGKYEAQGFCEFRDMEGDTYLFRVSRSPGQAGVLEGLHGIGKYAGMSLHGGTT